MTTLLVIVWVILAAATVLVLAMSPQRSAHSKFELKRRDDQRALRREKLLGDVIALQRVIVGLLLVAAMLTSVGAIGALGVVVTGALWLAAGLVTRWQLVGQTATKLYGSLEPGLLDFVERTPIVGWLTRTKTHPIRDQKLESPEQLRHLVESAGHILSAEQLAIITRGIDWHTTSVESIMVPAKDIFSVKHTELLGPLVLDDLHKSGHTRFPVTKGSVNTVVGILDISQSLDVTTGKRSETVEKTMSSQVLRIEADEPLPAALDMLQKSHLHMLIVVDSDGATVGLLTLADIAESLLGKNRGGVV